MSNISPVLPLRADPQNGFANNHTEMEAIIQDLKMLLLTSPGERIMDPNFGVGMRQFVFEQNDPSTYSRIKAKILRQTQEYLPFLDIEEILFNSENNDSRVRPNALMVTLKFMVSPLGVAGRTDIEI